MTSRSPSKFECRFDNSLCESLTGGYLARLEAYGDNVKLLAKDEKSLRCGFTPMLFHDGAEENLRGGYGGSNELEKAPPFRPRLSAALPTSLIRDPAISPDQIMHRIEKGKSILPGVQGMKVPRFSPTRLIDVGVSGCTNIILRETNDVHQYIALSYHWDEVPPLALVDTDSPARGLKNTISLQEFRSGLRLSNFPKTFRDAIHLVQSMKLRYLWIDSLCLLNFQDKLSTQPAQIHAIYGNALCVLVARNLFDCAFSRLRLSTFFPVNHHTKLSELQESGDDLDRHSPAEAHGTSQAAIHKVVKVDDEDYMARLLVTRARPPSLERTHGKAKV